MSRVDDYEILKTAIGLQQKGSLNEAAHLYRQLILSGPNNFYALHFLGVIEAAFGNIEQAKLLMARSFSIQPSNIQFLENYASILFQAGDYTSAVEVCQQGLQLNNANTVLLYVNAISLFNLSKLQESITQFDKLLLIQPSHIAALNERGSVLAEMKQYDAALSSVENALAIDPRYAEAHLNKGNLLSELKRYDESIVAFGKALSLNPRLGNAWLGCGNVFRNLKRQDEAFAAYDKALALKPDLEGAWLGRGNVFYDLKRYDEAFAAYDKALALKPDLASAWLGRGNLFYDLKRYDEAFAAYDKALALKPDLESAWLGRGNVFYDLKRYDEAFAAYDKAFALEPDLISAEGARLNTKMHICDWTNFDAECAHLIASLRRGRTNTNPFTFLGIPALADDQLRCAELWVEKMYRASQTPILRSERSRHDRIRIAYVSADFHDHATSHLMAGMFELHDRSRFEITAISTGPEDDSEIQRRLRCSFEHFIDARALSDLEIASHIRDAEIDILIDLKGFTQDSRTNVFALRPAPIQVSYLGYPGTMGASFIDYIIADQLVIPDEGRKFYSEKIVVLPNTYQVNDRQRVISDKAFTRADIGLPSQGFVYCCFNNKYKITPYVFDRWMRILKQVDDSVLWLLEDNASSVCNLKNEANARGVNSDRLVFAKRMLPSEHLARHKLADLFLDTLPYNAHTTASDALWAGLPVLTCLGETFAGRVAASLLNAIGLSELITTTFESYERMAVDLATHPGKLATIKRKLSENRCTTPLFDTKLFTKHMETAYTKVHERHQAGLNPDHIIVAS
jgi:protein O-GlcNAc transferase